MKIATYNILLSRHPDEVVNTLSQLVGDGVSVICLQEVLKTKGETFIIDRLLKKLGSEWKAIFHLGNEDNYLAFGTCIIWNSKVLTLKESEKMVLPVAQRIGFHEWVFGQLAGFKGTIPQRRTITGLFTYGKTLITISSVHLDTIQGMPHRLEQIRFFIK
ncbi:hypothetical protein HY310_02400 [Candidatus Microgenomates bacterium]|nr:hypothetical protein [Candidatus Microgenomates bacterium]